MTFSILYLAGLERNALQRRVLADLSGLVEIRIVVELQAGAVNIPARAVNCPALASRHATIPLGKVAQNTLGAGHWGHALLLAALADDAISDLEAQPSHSYRGAPGGYNVPLQTGPSITSSPPPAATTSRQLQSPLQSSQRYPVRLFCAAAAPEQSPTSSAT
ncbi:hypothetical protein ON010_g6056 [Phytophthora cinnamomi]|nr:hypothetical protein ON010_g6056 [Phytophthora cinnamomi]